MNWSRLYGKATSWRNDHVLFTHRWIACPPASRSCSVDALSAAARRCWGLDGSESSVWCGCAGGSAGESAGVNAAAGSTAADRTSGSHPVRCRGGTVLLEQLLPCSTCCSPGPRPTEAPAGGPCTAQGNKLSNNPLHSVSAAFTQRGRGYFPPSVLLLVFYPFFFFSLLMNQSLGESNAFV